MGISRTFFRSLKASLMKSQRTCENARLTTNGYGHLSIMTVLTTVFFDAPTGKPHAYWRVTPFSIIARYVERMLNTDKGAQQDS